MLQANSFRTAMVVLGAVLVGTLWWNGGADRYQLGAAMGTNAAWRIDTATGNVSVCFVRGADKAPECTPWGQRLFAK